MSAQSRERRVLCFAYVTNQLGQAGDFEKGEGDGAVDALAVMTAVASALMMACNQEPGR